MAAAADDGVEREAVSPLPIVFSSFLCIQNEVHILKEKRRRTKERSHASPASPTRPRAVYRQRMLSAVPAESLVERMHKSAVKRAAGTTTIGRLVVKRIRHAAVEAAVEAQ